MDFEANDIMYAAEFYEYIWEDAPGETPTASPNAPSDVGIQVVPNPVTGSPTVTEERRFNTECPICHEDLTTGQDTVHYRCGHVTCTVCYDNLIHSGWNSCTICRRSARRRRVVVSQNNDNDSDDIGVFIRPRTVVDRAVEYDIERCRAEMERHKEAIMDLVRQLTTHQFEYDENKARLDDLLNRQASRAAPSVPPAAAPSAPASAAVS